jgi:hypothetical protein
MVQNVNPTFAKTPNRGFAQISSGTGSSGLVTPYTGGANGSKVISIVVTATTTQPLDVQWGVLNATSSFILYGTKSVPAFAGSTDSIAAVNLLDTTATPGLPLDSDGNVYVFLASSADQIAAKSPTLVASGGINVTVPSAGDF